MLQLGDQLYELTSKDRETLWLEPFIRGPITAVASGAATVALALIDIPVDRCLYVDSVSFLGQGYVAAITWAFWTAEIDAPYSVPIFPIVRRGNASNNPLISDGAAAAVANGDVQQTVAVKFLCPPGCNRVRLQAITPAKAVDATAIWWVNGYLIPPGRIGRR